MSIRCLSGVVLVLLSLTAGPQTDAHAQDGGWKAGVAKAVITPDEPIWMAGYGNRTHPAEGKETELWIKIVALEDASGKRAVVLTSDTLGIPQAMYNNVCAAVMQKFEIPRSRVMLHCSHTHCGPVLRAALLDIYPLNAEESQKISAYSAGLEKTIVETIGTAIERLTPARLFAGQGQATFAVNRRNNLEPEVPQLRAQDKLKGPVDHAVPVLVVRAPDGKTNRAVVFGYACHNTTLSYYKWCGDYAGFAQMALEERHPELTAMFYSGCGADQNPLPRRTVELSKGYGKRLADAVDRVLAQPMTQLKPTLEASLELVKLNLGPEPTREELTQMAFAKPSYTQRWAARLLKQLDAGKPFFRTYPYPVQVWQLGNQQMWITLGGEVVVDYSLGFKKAYGKDLWVAGYCNDVMAYIPSLRVLEEDVPPQRSSRWGYEGNRSMMVYGMPCHRWKTDVEELIAASVKRQIYKVTEDEAP